MSHTDTNKHQVIVYSTTWCGYCKMAMKYFQDKGVEFIDKDVEADPAAMQEVMELMGGQFRGVPVIRMDDKVILGFDRPTIDLTLHDWQRQAS